MNGGKRTFTNHTERSPEFYDRLQQVLENAHYMREQYVAAEQRHQRISLRAYQLYEQRGMKNGREMDDWLHAEAEVRLLEQQAWRSVKPAVVPKSGMGSMLLSA